MAQLTGDQKITILTGPNNGDFFNRIREAILNRAQVNRDSAIATLADVNRRTQKRKRYANTLLTTSLVDTIKGQAGQFWLVYYTANNPVVDANGIPTYTEIFNQTDIVFDFLAGYIIGDENNVNIDW